ncbi:hypothetical protein AB5I41_04370 [Sphingomonas sp. MMS24-JH45]
MKSVGEVMAIGRNIHGFDAEGVARAGDGPFRLQPGRRPCRRAARGDRGGARLADPRRAAGRGAGIARGLHRRRG